MSARYTETRYEDRPESSAAPRNPEESGREGAPVDDRSAGGSDGSGDIRPQASRSLPALLKELLFPTHYTCLLCGRETTVGEDGICPECRSGLSRMESYRTLEPLGEIHAAFAYTGSVRNAMHRFKYNGAARLADFFMRYVELPEPGLYDCIVPVPMHPFKQYLRRYNPAEQLAEALSERCDLPVETGLLVRTRLTASQTKKSREERAEALAGLYEARPEIAGLRVLLVDDVVTTGSTLRTCARACLRAGAASVGGLCACDTPEKR